MIRRAGLLLATAVVALVGCQRKEEAAPSAAAPAVQAPAVAVAPVPTLVPPKRKPGLWAQTVSSSGMVQTASICVDESVEKAMGWWGQQATRDMCSKKSVTPAPGGGWRIDAVCDMGTAGLNTTTGVATGDFSTAYRVELDSVTTGAGAPHMNGSRKSTVEAAWKGPCPAGMKPGDMDVGGMRINVLAVAESR